MCYSKFRWLLRRIEFKETHNKIYLTEYITLYTGMVGEKYDMQGFPKNIYI